MTKKELLKSSTPCPSSPLVLPCWPPPIENASMFSSNRRSCWAFCVHTRTKLQFISCKVGLRILHRFLQATLHTMINFVSILMGDGVAERLFICRIKIARPNFHSWNFWASLLTTEVRKLVFYLENFCFFTLSDWAWIRWYVSDIIAISRFMSTIKVT